MISKICPSIQSSDIVFNNCPGFVCSGIISNHNKHGAASWIAYIGRLIDNITDMREEALDMEQLQKRPGLVGYIAKDGDSLWSIAKENHTTVEDILRDNHRTDGDLRRGEKILIVKKVELNSYEL